MKRMSRQQRSKKEENIEGLSLTVENKDIEKKDDMCNRQRMWKNRKKERKEEQEELGGR
jgi:hypothetical protein